MKKQDKQPKIVAQPLPVKYAELSDQELEVVAGGSIWFPDSKANTVKE